MDTERLRRAVYKVSIKPEIHYQPTRANTLCGVESESLSPYTGTTLFIMSEQQERLLRFDEGIEIDLSGSRERSLVHAFTQYVYATFSKRLRC